jgi:hypothetical protein
MSNMDEFIKTVNEAVNNSFGWTDVSLEVRDDGTVTHIITTPIQIEKEIK